MISAVLYGRNDNYGYNLHKRASLSFNCIAEVLTDPADEIIFVDYNTPDDFPTFPEAIQDTLTDKARGMLRILRVRPAIHERYRHKTALVAIEPVARNIGALRSRPENRWVLSTNTDMIFVPVKGDGISRLVADLPKGFYHAPRIEIPETLWESFDRKDPTGIISRLKTWGQTLHLNEIVLGADSILYDAPGDFQLIERADLFANHGFNEDMLLGWHVDSNIAKRLFLKYGKVGDLGRDLFGYHCDHTRQTTPMHSHTRTENDIRTFIDLVTRPDLPKQAGTWGCPDDPIEEISLRGSASHVYVKALEESIGAPMLEPAVVGYQHHTYDKTDYDPRHIMPFLADLFAASPRDVSVGWYGGRLDTLAMFAKVWAKLGLKGSIYCDDTLRDDLDLPGIEVKFVSAATMLDQPNAYIFDFGWSRDHDGKLRTAEADWRIKKILLRALKSVAMYERIRLKEKKPARRVIGLNVIHNRFEVPFRGVVGASITPFSTRLRHGYVLPGSEFPENWLPQLSIGPNGVRTESGIANLDPAEGLIAYGPYKYLAAGKYGLTFSAKVAADERVRTDRPTLLVEIVDAGAVCGRRYFSLQELKSESCSFNFYILDTDEIGGVEARLFVLAPVSVEIQSLIIREAEPEPEQGLGAPPPTEINSLIPILTHTEDVIVENDTLKIPKSVHGFAVYGPYLTMAPGLYKLLITVERDDDESDKSYLGYVDVTVQDRVVAQLQLRLNKLVRTPTRLYVNFEIPPDPDSGLVETRVWSSGEVGFKITSIAVVSQAAAITLPAPLGARNDNWLPYLALNTFAHVDERGVHVAKGQTGQVVAGPYWPLEAGRYEMISEIELPGGLLRARLVGRAEVTAFFGSLIVASFDIWTADPSKRLFSGAEKRIRNALRPLLDYVRKNIYRYPSLHKLARAAKRRIARRPMFAPPNLRVDKPIKVVARVPFKIPEVLADKPMIEARIWSSGQAGFCLKSVVIKSINGAAV